MARRQARIPVKCCDRRRGRVNLPGVMGCCNLGIMERWSTGVMGNRNLARSLKVVRAIGCIVFLVFVVDMKSDIHAQANFYNNKTTTVIVSSTPGGLYDLWGRLFAHTIEKYIPNNPNMLVQNMPRTGSLVASNY